MTYKLGRLPRAIGFIGLTLATLAPAYGADKVNPGQLIAFDESKGNCLACHEIAGGSQAGDIGPVLKGIKQRYPDRAKLRALVWDASSVNPNTIMPPYGRHRLLSEQDIDQLVNFLLTL